MMTQPPFELIQRGKTKQENIVAWKTAKRKSDAQFVSTSDFRFVSKKSYFASVPVAAHCTNCSSSPFAVTVRGFSLTISPAMSCLLSSLSSFSWIARFTGLAPNAGS